MSKCSKCQHSWYCSKECQTEHWDCEHKHFCSKWASLREIQNEYAIPTRELMIKAANEEDIDLIITMATNATTSVNDMTTSDIEAVYESLPAHIKIRYTLEDTRTFYKVLLTNSLAQGPAVSFFLNISRLNHSCLPTHQVIPTQIAPVPTFKVCAIRNTLAASELTISYRSAIDSPFRTRIEDLKKWGFTCDCVLCKSKNGDGRVNASRLWFEGAYFGFVCDHPACGGHPLVDNHKNICESLETTDADKFGKNVLEFSLAVRRGIHRSPSAHDEELPPFVVPSIASSAGVARCCRCGNPPVSVLTQRLAEVAEWQASEEAYSATFEAVSKRRDWPKYVQKYLNKTLSDADNVTAAQVELFMELKGRLMSVVMKLCSLIANNKFDDEAIHGLPLSACQWMKDGNLSILNSGLMKARHAGAIVSKFAPPELSDEWLIVENVANCLRQIIFDGSTAGYKQENGNTSIAPAQMQKYTALQQAAFRSVFINKEFQ
eukprot:GDKJ01040021.1.p1 GENE.GDKJ01040021.1~~GDKJ01040021.1.p1  ORF type:complete len:550 (-),score=108.53 GDKJ01040021.1:184-1653(-)